MENNLDGLVPNVTIGITTYNRPEMLREAVLSVLNQSYGNFDLLIGNDYIKTPVTFETLGIKPDLRVRILNYSSNMGEICNMNHLLELSQTEWFVWMADDDLFHQSFLELSLNSISSGSEVTAVYSEYTAEASPKKEFFDDVKNVKSNNLIQNVFIPKYTAREIKIIGVYGLMKTKALKEIGGMPSLGSSFGPYSDTLVPILLSQFGSINFLQTSLCFLRTHDESLSISSFDVDEYSSSASDFLTEFINICRTVENINTEKCVFNMVSWFRDNDLDIISRNHSISKFRAGYNFICHQLKNNYSKIRPRYWLGFTISIISLLAVFTVRSMYKKIRI